MGAFASVWLGFDDALDAPVAIKVLSSAMIDDLDVRSRFLEEARILRRADSERLISVHDMGELPDHRPYFVMSYADRGTLADRLNKQILTIDEALRLAVEIALGVSVVHSLGIIHRDLKPSNVLFQSGPGGTERVVIADLGLAKALAHASGVFTLPVGTPGYMSPEQMGSGGGLDVRADVYGLGALAYHLVTRRPPGPAPVRAAPSELREEIPAAVDRVVMRALEMDRERRWPDADSFAQALRDVRAELATQAAAPESAPTPTTAPVPEQGRPAAPADGDRSGDHPADAPAAGAESAESVRDAGDAATATAASSSAASRAGPEAADDEGPTSAAAASGTAASDTADADATTPGATAADLGEPDAAETSVDLGATPAEPPDVAETSVDLEAIPGDPAPGAPPAPGPTPAETTTEPAVTRPGEVITSPGTPVVNAKGERVTPVTKPSPAVPAPDESGAEDDTEATVPTGTMPEEATADPSAEETTIATAPPPEALGEDRGEDAQGTAADRTARLPTLDADDGTTARLPTFGPDDHVATVEVSGDVVPQEPGAPGAGGRGGGGAASEGRRVTPTSPVRGAFPAQGTVDPRARDEGPGAGPGAGAGTGAGAGGPGDALGGSTTPSSHSGPPTPHGVPVGPPVPPPPPPGAGPGLGASGNGGLGTGGPGTGAAGTGLSRRTLMLIAGAAGIVVIAAAVLVLLLTRDEPKPPADNWLTVRDSTGRITVRVPPEWKRQPADGWTPAEVRLSDQGKAPALRATPDLQKFRSVQQPTPGVFVGLSADVTPGRLPPPGLVRPGCTAQPGRPHKAAGMTGTLVVLTCPGGISYREVGLYDPGKRFAVWVEVKQIGGKDLTAKILSGLRVRPE